MSDDNPEPGPGPVAGGRWVSISEAARVLEITRQAVQRRIGRGTLETRTEGTGNRSRLLVRVPPPPQEPGRQPVRQPSPATGAADVQIARLEERLAAAEESRAELRRELAEVKAALEVERERVDGLLSLLAERRPERRPWPGLKAWWRRVWAGEG
jgi:hypothetical protein